MSIRTIFFLLIVSIFLMHSLGFAEMKKVGFENKHTVRVTTRSDDDDYSLYLTRANLILEYDFSGIGRSIKLLPFFEYQSNFDTNTWWRKVLGAEIGTAFFDDCFYIGSSFQHVWQKEENYPIELLDETTECQMRFVITPPLRWGVFRESVKLRIFDEYTYDFTRGQSTFNDVGVVLDCQVLDWLRIPVGWRHTDRVHDFDTDSLEFSLLFSF